MRRQPNTKTTQTLTPPLSSFSADGSRSLTATPRSPHLSSTTTQNPFYNANLIWIKYCSSDSWFGDAGASPSTFGYNFRGSRIVSATVTALMQYNGMGSEPNTKFLLAGCSAGGRGVMGNIDTVAAMLPNNIQFTGFIDAAAWVDIDPPPWIPGLQSLQSMTQEVYAFSNPPIPQQCAQMYAGEEWKCIWVRRRCTHLCPLQPLPSLPPPTSAPSSAVKRLYLDPPTGQATQQCVSAQSTDRKLNVL